MSRGVCVLCSEPITMDDWRSPWATSWAHTHCVQNEQTRLKRLVRQDAGELMFDLQELAKDD